jgi:TRAP-type C4-dicarboxylate transport system permease small subunit
MKSGILKKFDHRLNLFLKWGSIGCLIALLFFVAAGVFVRFVPISSMGWGDEIIELAFAWMVFLGATALWRERSHFRVDVLPEKLAGSKIGLLLEIFLSVLAFIFLLIFTYEGGILSIRATDRSPILEITRTFFYMVMPISGAIMVGYTIRDLISLSFFQKRSSPE